MTGWIIRWLRARGLGPEAVIIAIGTVLLIVYFAVLR
jgi:hypothetical protein